MLSKYYALYLTWGEPESFVSTGDRKIQYDMTVVRRLEDLSMQFRQAGMQ
jgi:hypothetical protein